MQAVDEVRTALRAVAEPHRATMMAIYVRAAPGQYGEGDQLLGVRVPEQRRIARLFAEPLGIAGAEELMASPWHEERLTALLVLVRLFQHGDAGTRERIHRLYLRRSDRVNNWDLVDLTAPELVGRWLAETGADRGLLDRLAASDLLWERRIAMVATHWFIRHGEVDDALRIATRLLGDRHDLMHKAVGWMLREVGKRDEPALRAFLDRHATAMPRTALRYAIERFPDAVRRDYLRRR